MLFNRSTLYQLQTNTIVCFLLNLLSHLHTVDVNR